MTTYFHDHQPTPAEDAENDRLVALQGLPAVPSEDPRTGDRMLGIVVLYAVIAVPLAAAAVALLLGHRP